MPYNQRILSLSYKKLEYMPLHILLGNISNIMLNSKLKVVPSYGPYKQYITAKEDFCFEF